MTEGTSQGLFIVVAIVIFGIFTLMAYILFEDTLSPALANMFTDATENTEKNILLAKYKGENLLLDGNKKVKGISEFVTFSNVSPIFNMFGETTYTVSFDIRVAKPGRIVVYSQNGSSFQYVFSDSVMASTEWQRMKVVLKPVEFDKTHEWYHKDTTLLAFYGIYDTGIIPEVKDVKVELGTVSNIPNYKAPPKGLIYN